MTEEEIDRVIIKCDLQFCQLIIPTKRDWTAIYLLGFGVFITSISLILIFLSSLNIIKSYGSLGYYVLLPIIFFILITRLFLWNTIGKEVITIDKGIMTIDRFWMFFFTPVTYNLSELKNLRTEFDDDSYEEHRWNWDGRFSDKIKLGGTFVFDYGLQTIKFGDSVDKEDADLILQRLKELKVFTKSNFAA